MRCDFETDDLCGWVQDTTTDEFDWTWQNYGTPSSHLSTGPSFDHTLGQGKGGKLFLIANLHLWSTSFAISWFIGVWRQSQKRTFARSIQQSLFCCDNGSYTRLSFGTGKSGDPSGRRVKKERDREVERETHRRNEESELMGRERERKEMDGVCEKRVPRHDNASSSFHQGNEVGYVCV